MALEGCLKHCGRLMRRRGRTIGSASGHQTQRLCSAEGFPGVGTGGLDAQRGRQHKLVSERRMQPLLGTMVFGDQTADRGEDVFDLCL
jgi:hypothetical protein